MGIGRCMTDALSAAVKTAEALELEIDFTSPGWLREDTLRGLGLTLVPSCGACLSNMAIAPDGGDDCRRITITGGEPLEDLSL